MSKRHPVIWTWEGALLAPDKQSILPTAKDYLAAKVEKAMKADVEVLILNVESQNNFSEPLARLYNAGQLERLLQLASLTRDVIGKKKLKVGLSQAVELSSSAGLTDVWAKRMFYSVQTLADFIDCWCPQVYLRWDKTSEAYVKRMKTTVEFCETARTGACEILPVIGQHYPPHNVLGCPDLSLLRAEHVEWCKAAVEGVDYCVWTHPDLAAQLAAHEWFGKAS